MINLKEYFPTKWFKEIPTETKFEKLVRERKEKEENQQKSLDVLRAIHNKDADSYTETTIEECYKASGYHPLLKKTKKTKKTKIDSRLQNITINDNCIILNKTLREIDEVNENTHVVLYFNDKWIIFDFTNDSNREGALKINKYEKSSYIYLGSFSLPPGLKGKYNLHKEEITLRRNIPAIGGMSGGGFAEKCVGKKWVLELPILIYSPKIPLC